MLDESLIAYVVDNNALADLQRMGVSTEDFVGDNRSIWRFLVRSKREHDAVPSAAVLQARFPDLELPNTEERDVPMLLKQLRQRRKYSDFLGALNEAASQCSDQELVDEAIQNLQANLNTISTSGGASHIVDLFDPATTKLLLKEMRKRRRLQEHGIKTGLGRYDRTTGGLQRGNMVVIMGRPGLGKSWLDLLFVATAVTQGYSVMLYPLEMTLFDTACRLYTLFTQSMFGPSRTLKNLDLTKGRVNTRRAARLLTTLEDRYQGTLHVADIAALGDPYTNERIEAEVELHKPDMFWVDYLTLLKPPPQAGGDSDWAAVRQLSNGIKTTAMRRNVVGGCSAQVNREAIKSGNTRLPRLENIAYGDSIGQDADQVFSINRRGNTLFYALVKNRSGPEISGDDENGVRVKWNPNVGVLQETDEDG